MMKTEYTEKSGFLQRDGVEHEEYAEAYSMIQLRRLFSFWREK